MHSLRRQFKQPTLGKTLTALLLSVVLVTSLGSLASRCCTSMGCGGEGLTIHVESEEQFWPEGDYRVTLSSGDQEDVCSFTMPTESDSLHCYRTDGSEMELKTIGGVRLVTIRHPGLTPSASSVVVQIEHEEETIHNEEIDLDWTSFTPNGEGCSPTCHEADAVAITVSLGSDEQ